MSAYINGIGMISPQATLRAVGLPDEWKTYTSPRLTCIEPDYTSLIDPKMLRRMSRIVKMGLATAGAALKEACIDKPDAIVTGTAYGCLEDTGIFLKKMIDQQEVALNPTPFIQSTHNTIGSQIALSLQCLGYNQTYSQRSFSFEHALLDALMLTNDHDHVLAGGVDEMTDVSYGILNRFHLQKITTVHNSDLFADDSPGTLLGEGAAYFSLSNARQNTSYARIKQVATFHKASGERLQEKIRAFLSRQSMNTNDIDLVLTGKNGNAPSDEQYDAITQTLFEHASIGVYKQLCGEYPTATGFAVWLSANMLKQKTIPPTVLQKTGKKKEVRTILIYHQYPGDHHSLILLEAC